MRNIVILALIAGILFSSQQSLFAINVDSLLEKHMEALGGNERLSEITTVSAYVSLEYMGLTGTGQIFYKLPMQSRVNLDLGVIEHMIGFDGLTGWSVDENGKVRIMSAEEYKPFINELYLSSYSYLFPDRIPGTHRYVSEEIIEGVAYYQIALYPEGGDSVYIMINSETGLIDYRTVFDSGLQLVTHSTDFQELNGVKISRDEKMISLNGPINAHQVADSLFLNRDLPDSLFAVPGESGIDYLFKDNTDSLIIPIERINRHLFVEVKVNGQGPYKFMLDSGAGKNVLDSSLATELNLSTSGAIASRGIGGFGSIAISEIDSLNVDRLSLYFSRILVSDLSPFSRESGKSIGGILGYDFFLRFPLRIDFRKNQLTVYNPATSRQLETTGMQDFEVYFQLPVFFAELNGQKARLLFDLGAQTGILMRNGSEFCERNKSMLDTVTTYVDIMGIGGVSRVLVSTLDSMRLGETVIREPRILWSQSNDDLPFPQYIEGIIGLEILEKFPIFIDFANKKISFAEY